jgi:hypothetical protein
MCESITQEWKAFRDAVERHIKKSLTPFVLAEVKVRIKIHFEKELTWFNLHKSEWFVDIPSSIKDKAPILWGPVCPRERELVLGNITQCQDQLINQNIPMSLGTVNRWHEWLEHTAQQIQKWAVVWAANCVVSVCKQNIESIFSCFEGGLWSKIHSPPAMIHLMKQGRDTNFEWNWDNLQTLIDNIITHNPPKKIIPFPPNRVPCDIKDVVVNTYRACTFTILEHWTSKVQVLTRLSTKMNYMQDIIIPVAPVCMVGSDKMEYIVEQCKKQTWKQVLTKYQINYQQGCVARAVSSVLSESDTEISVMVDNIEKFKQQNTMWQKWLLDTQDNIKQYTNTIGPPPGGYNVKNKSWDQNDLTQCLGENVACPASSISCGDLFLLRSSLLSTKANVARNKLKNIFEVGVVSEEWITRDIFAGKNSQDNGLSHVLLKDMYHYSICCILNVFQNL